MKWINTLAIATVFTGMPLFGLAGCEREGPMERAGEDVDEVVDDAGDELEEIGDDIEDAVDD